MSDYFGTRKTVELGNYALDEATTLAYVPGQPVDIMRIIFVYTTANSGAGSVVTMQMRPAAGQAANQVSLGTFTCGVTVAAGAVEYFETTKPADLDGETAEDGSLRFTADPKLQTNGSGGYRILPGQDFALVSGGQGTNGEVSVFLEVLEQGFQPQAALMGGAFTELARTT